MILSYVFSCRLVVRFQGLEFHVCAKHWQRKNLNQLYDELMPNEAIIEFDEMKKFLVALNVKKPRSKEKVGPFCVALITRPRIGAALDIHYFLGVPKKYGDAPAMKLDYLKQIFQRQDFKQKFGNKDTVYVIYFSNIPRPYNESPKNLSCNMMQTQNS